MMQANKHNCELFFEYVRSRCRKFFYHFEDYKFVWHSIQKCIENKPTWLLGGQEFTSSLIRYIVACTQANALIHHLSANNRHHTTLWVLCQASERARAFFFLTPKFNEGNFSNALSQRYEYMFIIIFVLCLMLLLLLLLLGWHGCFQKKRNEPKERGASFARFFVCRCKVFI